MPELNGGSSRSEHIQIIYFEQDVVSCYDQTIVVHHKTWLCPKKQYQILGYKWISLIMTVFMVFMDVSEHRGPPKKMQHCYMENDCKFRDFGV